MKFAESVGAKSLSDLRARPAAALVTAAVSLAGSNTDGYVLPETPLAIFQKSNQNHVPALVGSNSDEGRLFARGRTTAQEFIEQARQRYRRRVRRVPEAVPGRLGHPGHRIAPEVLHRGEYGGQRAVVGRGPDQGGSKGLRLLLLARDPR